MMRNRTKLAMAAAALSVLALGQAVLATNPGQTSIIVPDLDCNGCAKKVAAKLYAVPGVGAVSYTLEGKAVFVAPKDQQFLSPRALWEAVEKAGKHPTRLEGPGGTFTKKPQS